MRLIKLLQRAHAIEIGAYHAYEGHWRSLSYGHCRATVKTIQQEELQHREDIARMLRELKAKPSPVLDCVLWVIGQSISFACRFMNRRMALWGAKIMERFGSVVYKDLVKEARDSGYLTMGVELERMQQTEEKHEKFFVEELA